MNILDFLEIFQIFQNFDSKIKILKYLKNLQKITSSIMTHLGQIKLECKATGVLKGHFPLSMKILEIKVL